MILYGIKSQQRGTIYLKDLVEDQAKKLKEISRMISQQRDEEGKVDKMLAWVSDLDAFDDHLEVRERLGDGYLTSGQWLFHIPAYKDWETS